MKKCPGCGSISIDDRQTCGVCGTSLEGLVHLSLEQAESVPNPEFHLAMRSKKSAIIGPLFGVGVLLSGVFTLYFVGPFGIMLLIFGLAIIMIGVTSQGRPARVWRGRSGVGGYKGISDDQQKIEESLQEDEE